MAGMRTFALHKISVSAYLDSLSASARSSPRWRSSRRRLFPSGRWLLASRRQTVTGPARVRFSFSAIPAIRTWSCRCAWAWPARW